MSISKQILSVTEAMHSGNIDLARGLHSQLLERIKRDNVPIGPRTTELLARLRKELNSLTERFADANARLRVGSGCTTPDAGISVVTCARNRTENLLLALPTWLAHDRISEVLIVDWTSDTPVENELSRAGVTDRRVRVIRVEDEPRWILSYAFNLGFRMARNQLILKLDADIQLKADFFARNEIQGGSFIAGDWQVAEKGQEHINGFFYVHLVDLLHIKGFNEYITTYGWDDDDIYARLTGMGLKRVCVDPLSLYHIPHDDVARVGGATHSPINAVEELAFSTSAKIRANRFITLLLPAWNKDRVFAPFDIEAEGHRMTIVRRVVGDMPHLVSKDTRSDADHYAATELVSWQCGPTAYHLSRVEMRLILERKRLDEISTFDIDVALLGADFSAACKRRSLFLESGGAIDHAALHTLVSAIERIGLPNDVQVYVYGFALDQTGADNLLQGKVLVLPRWVRSDGLQRITHDDLTGLSAALNSGSGCYMLVTQDLVSAMAVHQVLSDGAHVRTIDSVSTRPKLYVDAQHGLGNRLRAIASAAAIANATGRELVIVWQPDHHCECRFEELFDYAGPVMEQSFHEQAVISGLSVFNYMEIEPNAAKDRQILLTDGVDAYVRSAYVLNHEASDWDSENRFLRSLTPSAGVQELIRSVDSAGRIGVHVRMEAGAGLDHNSYDSSENWSEGSHRDIHFWRERSHYSRFIDRLDAIIQDSPGARVFLAADLPQTYAVFREYYGDRVAFLQRDHFDRSAQQLLYALADAIILGRCARLLGSTWSSFSELAIRLSTTFEAIEMSGKDF